ncbi:MAG: hypothetical protein A2096_03545 [Spirochaetes bacterium GWF1_41_5]|nr:MAG: hypothetical protein A2096_03545 [Spirochaetes bacterium GWF1_41_5]HBE02304.1 hypothetical protein [Spirochaetia bacterium]
MKILTEKIKYRARELGFEACGITSADPFPEYLTAVRRLADFTPAYKNLYLNLENKYDPKKSAPWARSIIVCIRSFTRYCFPPGLTNIIGRNYLADARFPGNPDYLMIKNMTDFLRSLGLQVKKGGVPDRLSAVRSGIARMAKNTFIYTEKSGSWINPVTWRVNAELVPDQPDNTSPCPENCSLCRKNCPTGALGCDYTVYMEKCLSWINCHAPEPAADYLTMSMKNFIYGCDFCQTACPLNQAVPPGTEKIPGLDEIADHLRPEKIPALNEDFYKKHIYPRFWYIAENNLQRWKNNAAATLTGRKIPDN